MDLDVFKNEIQEKIDGMGCELAEFKKETLHTIEQAEKTLILDMLGKVNQRLSAIETKLAENDKDKEDGFEDDQSTAYHPKVR